MTVVIGFGNPLRGDDGLGAEVAQRVGALRPDVQVLTPHQLLPELASTIADATRVVFVDAATGGAPGSVECAPVRPGGGKGSEGHILSPANLMTLTSRVFGATPPAWLVRIHATAFELGAPLSAEARRAADDAVETVLELLAPPFRSEKVEVRR